MVLLILLSACGGNNANNSPGSPPALNGNYQISATSQVAASNSFSLGGQLLSSSGSFVATLEVFGPTTSTFTCLLGPFVTLKGTVDGQGRLSAQAGLGTAQGLLSLTATVSGDGQTLSNGTYNITGGCADGDKGTIAGFAVRSVTGTYAGSFTAGGTDISISLVLNQASTAFPDGNFELDGSAAFTNSAACGFSSGVIENVPSEVTSFVAGGEMSFGLGILPGPIPFETTFNFGGTASDATANTINGTFDIQLGPCAGQSGPLTLTRQ